jgi:hypothetical protein
MAFIFPISVHIRISWFWPSLIPVICCPFRCIASSYLNPFLSSPFTLRSRPKEPPGCFTISRRSTTSSVAKYETTVSTKWVRAAYFWSFLSLVPVHHLSLLFVQILQQIDETDHGGRSPSPEASSSAPDHDPGRERREEHTFEIPRRYTRLCPYQPNTTTMFCVCAKEHCRLDKLCPMSTVEPRISCLF